MVRTTRHLKGNNSRTSHCIGQDIGIYHIAQEDIACAFVQDFALHRSRHRNYHIALHVPLYRTSHCIGQDIGTTILHRKTLHVPLYRIFERTSHCIGQDIGTTILHRKTLHVPLYRIFERTSHCIGQDIGTTILHRKTLHVPLYRIFERKCCNVCSKTYIIIACGLEVMHILLVMNSLTTEDRSREYV